MYYKRIAVQNVMSGLYSGVGVESNRTNFELIFLEFFELKMEFRIN